MGIRCVRGRVVLTRKGKRSLVLTAAAAVPPAGMISYEESTAVILVRTTMAYRRSENSNIFMSGINTDDTRDTCRSSIIHPQLLFYVGQWGGISLCRTLH